MHSINSDNVIYARMTDLSKIHNKVVSNTGLLFYENSFAFRVDISFASLLIALLFCSFTCPIA